VAQCLNQLCTARGGWCSVGDYLCWCNDKWAYPERQFSVHKCKTHIAHLVTLHLTLVPLILITVYHVINMWTGRCSRCYWHLPAVSTVCSERNCKFWFELCIKYELDLASTFWQRPPACYIHAYHEHASITVLFDFELRLFCRTLLLGKMWHYRTHRSRINQSERTKCNIKVKILLSRQPVYIREILLCHLWNSIVLAQDSLRIFLEQLLVHIACCISVTEELWYNEESVLILVMPHWQGRHILCQ